MSLQPFPPDPAVTWYENNEYDFAHSNAKPVSYMINDVSQMTSIGLTATLNTMKFYDDYAVFWHVQLNSRFPAQQNVTLQLWFSPMWYANDSSQYVNFMCQDDISMITTSSTLKHTWRYSQTRSKADLNSVFVTQSGNTLLNTTRIYEDVWMMGLPQQSKIDETGFYSTGCLGGRDSSSTSSVLTSLKLNSNVKFRAGFKAFCNNFICAQSTATTSFFNYKIVDSSTATQNIQTNQTSPQATENLTNMPNASDPAKIWQQKYDPQFKNQLSAPNSYIIQPVFNKTGLVATLNSMKVYNSYVLFWNVQVNFQNLTNEPTLQQIWFAPKLCLGDSECFVNFICTDQITRSFGTVKHDWVYSQSQGRSDLNSLLTPNQFAVNLNDTWMMGQIQKLNSDSQEWNSTNCIGGFISNSDLSFFKNGSVVTFKAGYKLNCGGVVCGQSRVTQTAFNYTILDQSNDPTIPTVSMPAAQDASSVWLSDSKLKLNYTLATPVQYVVNNYTNTSNVGVVATLNTMKNGSYYTVFWNVQANFLKPLDYSTSITFYPMWVQENSTQFVGLRCVDEISINAPSFTMINEWSQYKFFIPTDNRTSIFQSDFFEDNNIWMKGDFQPNSTVDGWYIANCMGGRQNSYNSTILKNFKLNDKLYFKARILSYCRSGEKCAETSFINQQTLEYQIVDGTAKPAITVNVYQPLASDAKSNFIPSVGFNYTSAVPKYYIINDFNPAQAVQSGLVATLSTIKFDGGYGLFWNVQLNTKILPQVNSTYKVWFSPNQWYLQDMTQYVNFICQNDIYVSQNGAVKQKTKYIQTATKEDLNLMQSQFLANQIIIQDLNVYMKLTYTNLSDGFSALNCMGGRSNIYNSTVLVPFKLGSQIKFKAGFSAVNISSGLAQQKSSATKDFFSYTVFDNTQAQVNKTSQTLQIDPDSFIEIYYKNPQIPTDYNIREEKEAPSFVDSQLNMHSLQTVFNSTTKIANEILDNGSKNASEIVDVKLQDMANAVQTILNQTVKNLFSTGESNISDQRKGKRHLNHTTSNPSDEIGSVTKQ